MEQLYFVLALLGIIILIMVLQYINSRRNDKLYIIRLNKCFGSKDRASYDQDRLKAAPGYYLRHKSEKDIDDYTWNDLSMPEVFASADSTQSAFGCEVLYFLFRHPLYTAEEVSARREQLCFWRDNAELRSRIQLLLHNIGKVRKYSVYEYIESLSECKTVSSRTYILRIVLLILSVCSIIPFGGVGVIIFIIVLLFNLSTYYRDKGRIAPYLTVMDDINHLCIAAEEISRILEKENKSEIAPDIRTHLDKLSTFKRLGGSSASNPLVLLSNTVGFLVFADLFRFNKLRDKVSENYDDIDGLIYDIGYIDACISLASYTKANEGIICIPVFTDADPSIHLKGLTHPLIENAVDNDIDISRSILLTGSNASGKSTFLKSIALGMLMAQSVTYVFAKEYEAPLCRIMSTMSIKDDVCRGDSYYMAEIKAVKRIFDERDRLQGINVRQVSFVDELLRGTNTVERIAAATQILALLDSEGVLVCAATHDLELTGLLSDAYDNYHFREDLSEGDVRFSYKLNAGPADSRNAIALLKNLGYSEKITANAEAMVAEYEDKGTWVRKDLND